MPRKDQNQQSSSPFIYRQKKVSAPGQGEGAAPNTPGVADDPAAAAGLPADEPSRAGAKKGRKNKRLQKDTGSAVFGSKDQMTENPAEAYGYRRKLFGHKDEVSAYTAQMDAKHALDYRARVIVIAAVAVVIAFVLVLILPSGLFGSGKPAVTPALVVTYIQGNITGLVNWITGGPQTSGISIVFWQVLAIPVVGAVLALNGCVFQGALKNALAAPSTLGVMSGATLGSVVYTLLFAVPETFQEVTVVFADEVIERVESMDVLSYIAAASGRALCSLAGCFIVVALVLVIAYVAGRGKLSKVSLIIAGQVFTALISGVISVIYAYVNYYGSIEQQSALGAVVGGDLGNIVNPVTFLVMAAPLAVGIVVIMRLRFRLNLLAFNDEEAKSMGIKTMATRNGVIIVCTVLTGIVVSFVGSVGFVGFLVPHIARKVVGPDLRYLIPASMLFGSVFLLVAYYLMQLTGIFAGSLGTLTSLVGAVAFLVIAVRERARGDVSWV